MVIIRLSLGINPEKIFNVVVFPEPVPPEIRILSSPFTAASMNFAICGEADLYSSRLSMVRLSTEKRRIETEGPSKAKGGIMAFTREPSTNRASTIGDASSIRRPT